MPYYCSAQSIFLKSASNVLENKNESKKIIDRRLRWGRLWMAKQD